MNLNDLFNEEKVRLDPKCWTGKKIGNPKTKMKGGVRVNNCVPAESVEESTGQPLSVQQLATISDAALDAAYGYGRSTPGNTFGWQANMKSAAYAKQMIDQGITDIEAISDAIHKGWNTTAQAFVQDPEQFDDTAKLAAAGKLEAKLQQRAQLMKQNYAQLPEEEKEKDRVVARALLQAIRGEQDVAEGLSTDNLLAKSGFKEIRKMKHGAVYSNGHEAVSIRIDPSDPDVINWALGEVTGKRIEWIESGNDDKQEALHIIKTFTKQGVAEEQELDEKWSQKYKSSINCANPKGFSQKAHCAGRKKNEDVAEGVMYGAENLNVGDDVIVSGDVNLNGATGVIDSFGQDKRFVVVDLYNHGKHSFHSSDVSANDYDNDEHDDDDVLDEKSVSQAQFRTMAAAAHNPKFAKKVGISQDVAREFNQADKHSNYKKLPTRATEGEVVKTKTGLRHFGDFPDYPGNKGQEFQKDPETLNKSLVTNLDNAFDVSWEKQPGRGRYGIVDPAVDEGEQQKGADYRDPKEVNYDDDYDAMVARVKKLAGLGPMKTVYDPAKRVYKNVPTAVQPKK